MFDNFTCCDCDGIEDILKWFQPDLTKKALFYIYGLKRNQDYLSAMRYWREDNNEEGEVEEVEKKEEEEEEVKEEQVGRQKEGAATLMLKM